MPSHFKTIVFNNNLSLLLFQRLVEAAEDAHQQHVEDPDLQVCVRVCLCLCVMYSHHTRCIIINVLAFCYCKMIN